MAGRGTEEAPFSQGRPLDDVNTPAMETEPFIAHDGKSFYFVSDRTLPRGIFVSVMDDAGHFSEPRRIVNGIGRADAPTLSEDQLMMFFHCEDKEVAVNYIVRRDGILDVFDPGKASEMLDPILGVRWPEALSSYGCTLYFLRMGQRTVMMTTRSR